MGGVERIRPWRGWATAAASAVALAVGVASLPAADAAVDGGYANVGPTSSDSLLFGRDPQVSLEKLAIRKTRTRPRVLYSVRLSEEAATSTIDVRSMTQTHYCRSTDISGANNPKAECRGSKGYRFDPSISWKVVLSDSPIDATGHTVVRDWTSLVCRNVIHHCPVPARVDDFSVSGAGHYVNFVAAAHHRSAKSGQVIGVNHGVMQVIQTLAPPTDPPQEETSGPVGSSFPMSPGSSKADKDDIRPAVLFSQPVDVQEGDVLDARVQLRFEIKGSQDNAPQTATFMYLTDDPQDAEYPERASPFAAFQRAGENCPETCSFTRLGAIRSPVSGSMHVNVVAFVSDHEYRTKGVVEYDGTLSVTPR